MSTFKINRRAVLLPNQVEKCSGAVQQLHIQEKCPCRFYTTTVIVR